MIKKIIKVIAAIIATVAIIVFLLLVVLAIALSGGTCKEWTKDEIRILGAVRFAGYGTKYFELDVGKEGMPITTSNVSIKFTDGERLKLEEITLDAISKYNPRKIDYKNLDKTTTCYYRIDDSEFSFIGQRLSLFRTGNDLQHKSLIEIGNGKKELFFPLPLTEKQCETLFGVPENIRNIGGI